MKILFIGEYSNVHWTLAEGLRARGHQVTVVSDGNSWRQYPRDIDLQRRGITKWSGIVYFLRVLLLLRKMRGFDVVQLINPDCIWLKSHWQKMIYRYLRRCNRRIFVGAYGCDWYWVDSGLNKRLFRYGDFYIGDSMRTDEPQVKKMIDEWIDTPKGRYSQFVMNDCDGIPSCLYEYQVCYASYFPQKTRFIPLPIKVEEMPDCSFKGYPVRFFIGIDSQRMRVKGTDIMLRALLRIKEKYPTKCEVVRAVDEPFAKYVRMMEGCDVIVDQLYSYTPSMSPLQAMAKGIICVGGGEPEHYEMLGEDELRPIINVEPNEESVYRALEELLLHPERISELKRQSVEYVRRHHDYLRVAEQYEKMYLAT
ncbi:MAG: glycosyltransferase family 4 protein [Bacteroidaceae bacterium]|nr:glycosyltransferase family 4 protein [Bacteroidaceae bacterium]